MVAAGRGENQEKLFTINPAKTFPVSSRFLHEVKTAPAVKALVVLWTQQVA
jgi:hypothetical protein